MANQLINNEQFATMNSRLSEAIVKLQTLAQMSGRILLSHTRTDLTQECTRTLLHIPRFVLCFKILDFVRYLPAASNTEHTLVGIPRHFNLDYHSMLPQYPPDTRHYNTDTL